MKQTIEIEVPDGKKAIWKDDKIVFEDIIPQLPKTWEEFCKIKKLIDSEAYIDSNSKCIGIDKCFTIGGWERNHYNDRNILPSKKAAEAHLALMQLHQLRDCYRQGWIPNHEENSKKWSITKFKNKLYACSACHYSSFLSFQTEEIAEQFLTNFRELIEQAGDLI